jgi:hypothetical protein
MFCPKCRSEFRAGVKTCANCEVPLVEELGEIDKFASAEGMAELIGERDVEALVVGQYASLREVQRELAKRRIPTVIAGEAEEEVQTAMHNRLFLMVAADDLERARQALDERWKKGLATEGLMLVTPSAEPEGDAMSCPACGAAVPPDAKECPECELFLGAGEE